MNDTASLLSTLSTLTTILSKAIIYTVFLALISLLLRTLYRISPLHPLSHIPSPILARSTSLWLTAQAWLGHECRAVHALHTRHGAIVRTGPNSVDIFDDSKGAGTALHDIYVARGGFAKPAFYANFDIDGHKSVFSEVVPERRAVRAKAVIGLFATGSLRKGGKVLEEVVLQFVKSMREARAESLRMHGRGEEGNIDLLDLARGLAIDAVTGYLFGREFGGLRTINDGKAGGEMAANGMVDLFVGVGRFWYLPSWAFQWVDWFDVKFGHGSSKEVGQSLELVDEYVAGIVRDAETVLSESSQEKSDVSGVSVNSYPARLLAAGLSVSETRAQCKDLIFAGTDSTGMNLATIIFYLVKNPSIHQKLKAELESTQVEDLVEIQSLPYLRGVVREGLRLSMANPSRLPRVVPATGWSFQGVKFPAGTEVSCTPFELHLNSNVFVEPMQFRPERWIDGATAEMERDMIAFGLGSRQCIARNLATVELFLAVKEVVKSGCLEGAKVMKEKIEILEWFNSHVVGGKIEVRWDRD